MTRATAIEGVKAEGWQPHALHGEAADWAEKNCYADLWVALLHTLSLEPRAMLGHTVAVDFEGDQWTFFKPPHAELRELYGIDVQELTVWRPLEEHAVEQLSQGKLLSTEADAFWLPDTRGTDYRSKHTKTTVLMLDIDTDRRRLTYIHNAGCFALEGEDYERLFRIGALPDPQFMPLFAELVRIDRRVSRPQDELARRALAMLRRHYEWQPRTNPFVRMRERMAADMGTMRERGLEHYHAWAFASLRQAGSAFELAAAHVRWLADHGFAALRDAAAPFQAISSANKSLILKGARAVHTGKPLDVASHVDPMAAAWDEGMSLLGAGLQRSA